MAKKGAKSGGRARAMTSENSLASKHGLSAMQAAFVQAYLADKTMNATAAAEKAGYSSPRATAHRLLHETPSVRAAVQEAMDQRAERCDLSADKILREIAKMAFANMYDYIRVQEDGSAVVDLSELNRDRATAIQEVVVDTYTEGRGKEAREVKRIKFKLSDKSKNLELLGRHLKLFVVTREDDDPDSDVNTPPPATVTVRVVDGRKGR